MDKTYDEMTYLPKSTKEKMEEVLEKLRSDMPETPVKGEGTKGLTAGAAAQ